MQEKRVEKIKAHFFVNMFLMLDRSSGVYKNIPEILAREKEKVLVLGPVISRLLSSVIKPIVEFAFKAHLDNGQFPEVPPALLEQDMEVEFTSPFAQTQKRQGVTNIMGAFQQAVPILKADPRAGKVINTKRSIRKIFELYDVEVDTLFSPEEVKYIEYVEQQQIKQQQQAQAATAKVQNLKTLASADKDTGGKIAEAFSG